MNRRQNLFQRYLLALGVQSGRRHSPDRHAPRQGVPAPQAVGRRPPQQHQSLSLFLQVKTPFKSESLMKSIRLIRDFPDYEFPTTVVPGLTDMEDLSDIASLLSSEGADRNYVLQGLRPGGCLDSLLDNIKPFPEETLRRFIKGIRHRCGALCLRYPSRIR